MAKVLLVYPGIGISGWKKRGGMGSSGENLWIHHGLAIIGACLEKEGHEIRLADLRHYHGWQDYLTLLSNFNPDFVAISVSYLDTKYAMRCAELTKQNNANVKVMIGGLCPTLFSERFIDNANIDFIVTHEGESACCGIINGTITDRLVKGTTPDVSSLPFAKRDMFEYEYELGCRFVPTQELPVITMISGRGCPFHCTYCQGAESYVYGHKTRMRSVDHVIDELKELRDKYNFKSITWWDDTFTFNKKWIYEFCDKYEKNGFKQKFVACTRADITIKNEDMIKRLAEVGMDWGLIGIESGNQRILDFLKKGTTVDMNKRAIDICHKYGIKVFGTFMFGLPTETNQEAFDTYKFIKDNKPEIASVFYFTPIPGTEIFDYCNNNDLILRDDLLNIERTSKYTKNIKNVDYEYLETLRQDIQGENK